MIYFKGFDIKFMESLQIQESIKTKRIEYIDALRGFTIILVIYSHINIAILNPNDFCLFSFNSIFITFRMPLFFFISGFVLFKNNLFITKRQVYSFLIKKSKVQILPTLFFLTIYIIIFRLNARSVCESTLKAGYWFTLILFGYFLIYSVSYYIYRFICIKTSQVLIGISLLAGLVYILSTDPVITGGYIATIFSLSQYKYFIFFVFGTIVRCYYEDIQRLLKRNFFSTSIILGFIGITILLEIIEIQVYYVKILLQVVQSFAGILFVFMFFEKNQEWCSHETKIGRWLQYVGKRTLDIYLIHYFFLPHNLNMIGKFFYNYPNPTLEFFVSMFFAILVLSLSLVTSNLLRCSDFLTEWLFGRKKKI